MEAMVAIYSKSTQRWQPSTLVMVAHVLAQHIMCIASQQGRGIGSQQRTSLVRVCLITHGFHRGEGLIGLLHYLRDTHILGVLYSHFL